MLSKKKTKESYHALSVEETFLDVKSSRIGLIDSEVKARLQENGTNELPQDNEFSWLIVLWRQFNNPLVIIILVAGMISFFIGHYADAFFILIVIIVNSILGFLQDFKAETALKSLKKTIKPTAVVVRNAIQKVIETKNIVVGDVLVLKAGDNITADGRIFEINDFFVNEAVLTGESEDIEKQIDICKKEISIGDRSNMVFAGSHVTNGEAMFVVTNTGSSTEIGKIARLVKDESSTEEPLKKKFAVLSRKIGIVVLVLIAVFAIFSVLRGKNIGEVFVTSTALVVSVIPEGLLPAVTIVMIFGVRRLLRKKALVRKLGVTETIGAVTTICTDKTGTLTRGEMSASYVLTGSQKLLELDEDKNILKENILPEHLRTLEICGMVNNAFVENKNDELEQWIVQGRPTDKALLMASVKAGIDILKLLKEKERIAHIPFSSSRKFSANIYINNPEEKTAVLFAVGAPEVILNKSNKVNIGNEANINLSNNVREELEKKIELFANKGLRVVACAERNINIRNIKDSGINLVEELTLIGFVAIKDSIRKDAKDAIKKAKRAGIRTIIITGDHPKTTKAIISDLGWFVSDKQIAIGSDIENMSDKELQNKVRNTSIFARVAPKHKIRIVHALQKNNEIVAMVGDGVNDAPALKASHVGISMGNGADITKGVADIVLLNSSFDTIISAIEQGRVIFDNIRRIITYLLADDFSELVLFFVALMFGFPLPLAAVQILWINLIEDSLPNIALTTERDTKGIMDVPPRKFDEPILSASYRKFMFVIFLVSGVAAIILFVSVLKLNDNIELTQTMTFTLVAFDSLAMVYVLRSFRRSMLSWNIFNNKILNWSVIISLLVLIVGLYFEPLAKMLHVVPLNITQWGVIIFITLIEVIILEIAKNKIFTSRARHNLF